MKKLKKINLELNKEVISSLSGNEMNHVKGGTNLSYNPNLICTGTDTASINVNLCPQPVTINGITCVINLCVPQTINNCPTNGADFCAVTVNCETRINMLSCIACLATNIGC